MASSVLSPPRRLARTSFALVAAALVAACDPGAANAPGSKPQAVQTLTVALEPSSRTWSYVGTVKPRYQSDLGFRVGGKVVSRHVELGSAVRQGDILARLDPSDFELTLAAMDAELSAARTSRDETAAALRRFEVLFKDGHVAQAALDQRTSAAAEAKSRLERAERNVELARNQLAYATLASDVDGVVTALPVEAGQVVAAGQLVARVARRDAVDVEVALPEQDVEAVRDAIADIDIWGSRADRLKAVLREVAPDADPVSRTFRARFALADPGRAPALGRTATVHLGARRSEDLLALPLSAISSDGTASVAWVISSDGTRAVPRPVTIKVLEKDRALVASDLQPGDRVVAYGVHMLDPEKPIRPVEPRPLLSRK